MNNQLITGKNSIEEIEKEILKNKFKKILVVTGKTSYEKSNIQKIFDRLPNIDIKKFDNFKKNPSIQDLKIGIEIVKKFNPELIISIGGGSSIDMGKLICLFENEENKIICENPLNYEIKKKRKTPYYIIPTTAGSGSESTHFAVLYSNKIKYSIGDNSLLPNLVILDPLTILNQPKYLASYTAFDALSQAIESLWSINSTEESRKYSSIALEYIIPNLVNSVKTPNLENKEKILLGAHYAGKAINIAKTTAAHAVSYPITSYFNVPHGHAVALTLPSFLEFNNELLDSKECNDSRGIDFVKKQLKNIDLHFNCKNYKETSKKIKKIMAEIDLESSLKKLGIKNNKDIEIIIKNGFNPQRVKNNPRKLNENQLKKLLNNLY